jgi:hypothetical protein
MEKISIHAFLLKQGKPIFTITHTKEQLLGLKDQIETLNTKNLNKCKIGEAITQTINYNGIDQLSCLTMLSSTNGNGNGKNKHER